MKKNRIAFPVVLMVLAGLVFAAVFSCDNKDRGPTEKTYIGMDNDEKEYKLVITDEYYYELFIDGKSISTGWVIDIDGDTYQLRQSSTKDDFLATVEGNYITKIVPEREKIVLTPDDESDPIPLPGELLPPSSKPGEGNNPVEGKWIWYASGDSTPNDYLDVQTVFAPGGASKFTNWVAKIGEDGKPIKDKHGADTYAPYEYPEASKPKDKDGKAITGPVFNLKGNTKVIKEGRTANEGARFPLVGWGAIPDDDATKAALKTAYGYSFWVKLNSSTASNWAFLTAVQTDFPPEKGFEYKHWFGNKPGDSGGSKIDNFTPDLKVGTWYKITVVMAKDGFNMDEDAWLYKYPPNPDPKKPFNQAAASEIQWQIPLQHQEGAGVKARSGDPYDITNGSYDFDLDFYGLELLSK